MMELTLQNLVNRQTPAALDGHFSHRPGADPAHQKTGQRLEQTDMQLEMRLKKRWITSVLKEADAMSTPLPWQRRKMTHTSSEKRLSGPQKSDAIRA